MDGGIAGTGPASLQDSLPRSDVAGGSKHGPQYHAAASDLTEDEIAGSLLNLTNPEIGRLLDRLEQARLALDPEALDALFRTAVKAADSNDLPSAMAAISKLVGLDPERGAQLVRESVHFAPIRTEVNEHLQHLLMNAQTGAERTISAASRVIDGSSPAETAAQMLALAQRFVDTGQHLNFVRAQELAEAVLAGYPGTRPSKAPEQRTRLFTILGWASVAFLILVAFVLLVMNRA
jgi:hypothetical protein